MYCMITIVHAILSLHLCRFLILLVMMSSINFVYTVDVSTLGVEQIRPRLKYEHLFYSREDTLRDGNVALGIRVQGSK
jgi:hypothetical protein